MENSIDQSLANDLLRGAAEISRFLYGDLSSRRKIYHLAKTTDLPVFKLGEVLCARKSKLIAWIELQEQKQG